MAQKMSETRLSRAFGKVRAFQGRLAETRDRGGPQKLRGLVRGEFVELFGEEPPEGMPLANMAALVAYQYQVQGYRENGVPIPETVLRNFQALRAGTLERVDPDLAGLLQANGRDFQDVPKPIRTTTLPSTTESETTMKKSNETKTAATKTAATKTAAAAGTGIPPVVKDDKKTTPAASSPKTQKTSSPTPKKDGGDPRTFGFSVYAVIRALGKAGMEARDIFLAITSRGVEVKGGVGRCTAVMAEKTKPAAILTEQMIRAFKDAAAKALAEQEKAGKVEKAGKKTAAKK